MLQHSFSRGLIICRGFDSLHSSLRFLTTIIFHGFTNHGVVIKMAISVFKTDDKLIAFYNVNSLNL